MKEYWRCTCIEVNCNSQGGGIKRVSHGRAGVTGSDVSKNVGSINTEGNDDLSLKITVLETRKI